MTEQEKVISRLCIAMQKYCMGLREEYGIRAYDSYYMDCIEHCIERIRRRVNPDFNNVCETVEALETEEQK